MVAKLKRKVYFYKVIFFKNNKVVDPVQIFKSFNNNNLRLSIGDGNERIMNISDVNNESIKAQIATVRKNGLPTIENKGKISPLNIPASAGLFEPMHFVIFKNGVSGMEYNFYGPRPGSLKKYIKSKVPNLIDKIEINPLIRKDATNLFSKMGVIKSITIKINRSKIDFLEQLNDNLPDAFNNLKNLTDADSIELTLSVGRDFKKRGGLHKTFLERIQRMFHNGEHEDFEKLKVKAVNTDTEHIEEFDLLKEFIFSTVQVTKQNDKYRYIDSNEMYKSIINAYYQNKEEIDQIVIEVPR